MTLNAALLLKMNKILAERGETAKENVREYISRNFKDNSQISLALRYFSDGALKRSLPVFPTLIAISCEAAGGVSEETVAFGEAIVLLTGAADLHDDVIDQSILKGPNKTVFGKFGSNVAILAGDVLLVEGIAKLWKQAKLIDKKRGEAVVAAVTSAVFEISKAETEEFKLRTQGFNIKPDDYQRIIRQKATVPELAMKIGAILGNGDLENINSLSQFGRTCGYVTSVVKEFVDVLDCAELTNRFRNECPPLPIIYLLQDRKFEQKLKAFQQTGFLNEKTHQKLIDVVKNSIAIQKIHENLVSSVDVELQKMKRIAQGKTLEDLETLLLAPLSYLDDLFPLRQPAVLPNSVFSSTDDFPCDCNHAWATADSTNRVL